MNELLAAWDRGGPCADLAYDALVVGAGIAGLQAALDLADQGYSVVLDRAASQHRRRHDRPEQGLPDARLRELHHDPEDGRSRPSRPHHDLHLRGGDSR